MNGLPCIEDTARVNRIADERAKLQTNVCRGRLAAWTVNGRVLGEFTKEDGNKCMYEDDKHPEVMRIMALKKTCYTEECKMRHKNEKHHHSQKCIMEKRETCYICDIVYVMSLLESPSLAFQELFIMVFFPGSHHSTPNGGNVPRDHRESYLVDEVNDDNGTYGGGSVGTTVSSAVGEFL
jgi:hypothetical protein